MTSNLFTYYLIGLGIQLCLFYLASPTPKIFYKNIVKILVMSVFYPLFLVFFPFLYFRLALIKTALKVKDYMEKGE